MYYNTYVKLTIRNQLIYQENTPQFNITQIKKLYTLWVTFIQELK